MKRMVSNASTSIKNLEIEPLKIESLGAKEVMGFDFRGSINIKKNIKWYFHLFILSILKIIKQSYADNYLYLSFINNLSIKSNKKCLSRRNHKLMPGFFFLLLLTGEIRFTFIFWNCLFYFQLFTFIQEYSLNLIHEVNQWDS